MKSLTDPLSKLRKDSNLKTFDILTRAPTVFLILYETADQPLIAM